MTGLPNRSHVIESLEQMLAVPERKPVALLLVGEGGSMGAGSSEG